MIYCRCYNIISAMVICIHNYIFNSYRSDLLRKKKGERMRLGIILMAALTVGCGSKRVTVDAAPTVQACDPDLMMAHIMSVDPECKAPVIYQDIELEYIYYGMCEYGSDSALLNVAMPTELYHSIKESIEEDGGTVICSDLSMTILGVPDL